MFAVFMSICLGISLVVLLTYIFATKGEGRYTTLITLIMNLAAALLGLALAIDLGKIVSGMIISFVNSILAGYNLGRLLLEDPADKTEEKKQKPFNRSETPVSGQSHDFTIRGS